MKAWPLRLIPGYEGWTSGYKSSGVQHRGLQWTWKYGRKTPFHVSCSLAVREVRQAPVSLTLRAYPKHGHKMDELGCIQQTLQRQNVPHTNCRESKTAGNLIDFINISKEGMCQSERGFGGEGLKRERGTRAVRFPGAQRRKALTSDGQHSIWPSE